MSLVYPQLIEFTHQWHQSTFRVLTGYMVVLHAARRCVGGSLIGGIRETQEMLNFCGKHHIFCKIEKIPFDYLNEAMKRLAKSDVKYRFVIDVANSTPPQYRPCC